jgi:4'-phosphopantetheinyl transferase
MTGIVYYATYPMPLTSATFEALLAPLPPYMQKKIGQFRRWEDAHASLLGKHLLLAALKAYGSSANLHDMRYSGFGRPYLEGGIDFNISHAGRMVACIVSPQARVGIDVEAIRPVQLDDFKGQFSEREWNAIKSAANPLQAFYRFWTCKEAILKADGSGLHTALTALDVTDKKSVMLDGRNWHLQEITSFRDYACHVAADKKGLELKVEEVKF